MKSTISSLAVAALLLGSFMAATPAVAQRAKDKAKPAAAPAAAEAAAPAAAPAPAPSTAAPTGALKIGVIKSVDVLKGYAKFKTEFEALQKDCDDRQKKLEALKDKVNNAVEAYKKEKEKLSPEARVEKETELQKQQSDYQVQFQSNQGALDAAEAALRKKVMGVVDQVIQQIGAREGYHLIVDASSRPNALYFSPTIDLTQRVIDELNKQ